MKKPEIILVIASSLDGRIAYPQGGETHLGSGYDKKLLNKSLTTVDATLFGSGAGDSVIAAAALGLSIEITAQELCTISNLAGGLACEKAGVVPVQKENLLAALTH